MIRLMRLGKTKKIKASLSLYSLLRVSYCEGVMPCLAFALYKNRIYCTVRLRGPYI